MRRRGCHEYVTEREPQTQPKSSESLSGAWLLGFSPDERSGSAPSPQEEKNRDGRPRALLRRCGPFHETRKLGRKRDYEIFDEGNFFFLLQVYLGLSTRSRRSG
ncbi:hypothetical protein VTL71DRAFT_7134, partial [Oculimacula yallundae]